MSVQTPCCHKGCAALTPLGERYCAKHKQEHAWHRTDGKTTTQRGYGASWRRLRSIVLTEEPLCALCKRDGRVSEATEVDHITPKANGGTDARNNLQGLCKSCHAKKTGEES